jgi:hypothetical protein
MSNPGLGVMLSTLGGNAESAAAMTEAIGKRIVALELSEEKLSIALSDGSRVELFDDGQSCCESRYMRTDDSLSDFVGAELRGAEVREAANLAHEWGDHEVQFLLVQTDKGDLTISAHNEHNGYYGGFSIRCRTVSQ